MTARRSTSERGRLTEEDPAEHRLVALFTAKERETLARLLEKWAVDLGA
ncbi:hypothetical protein [Nocardioides sp. KR10-350]